MATRCQIANMGEDRGNAPQEIGKTRRSWANESPDKAERDKTQDGDPRSDMNLVVGGSAAADISDDEKQYEAPVENPEQGIPDSGQHRGRGFRCCREVAG